MRVNNPTIEWKQNQPNWKEFENIFVRKYKHDFDTNMLDDNKYIEYLIWEDKNWEMLKEKHSLNVIRGTNPNIIFHGGCIGCRSQEINGIDRCRICQYFRGNYNKPDLSIKNESKQSKYNF